MPVVIPMAWDSGLALLPDIPGLSDWGKEPTLLWSGREVREKNDPRHSCISSFLSPIRSFFWVFLLEISHGLSWQPGKVTVWGTYLRLCQQDIVYQLDPGFAKVPGIPYKEQPVEGACGNLCFPLVDGASPRAPSGDAESREFPQFAVQGFKTIRKLFSSSSFFLSLIWLLMI